MIDSWAWMEYVEGSPRGKKVKEFLQGIGPFFCATISVAEVSSKLKRRGSDSETGRKAIIANAKLIELDETSAYEAGQIHAEMRKRIIDFGMADAVVLACARKLGAKILTGDPHFKGVKDAVMI